MNERPTDPWEQVDRDFKRSIEFERQRHLRDTYIGMLVRIGKELGCTPALTGRGVALIYRDRKVLEATDFYMYQNHDLELEEKSIRASLANLDQSL